MKINETLHAQREPGIGSESRENDGPTIAQMKGELYEFVAQTRRRLSLVSKSLVELDHEPSCPSSQDVCNLEPPIATQSDSIVPPVSIPSGLETRNELEDAPNSDSDSFWSVADPSDESEFWPSVNEGPTLETDQSAQTPLGEVIAEPIERERDEVADGNARDTNDHPSIESGPMPGPIDTDSDPLERLNAIKARLAKQIENA